MLKEIEQVAEVAGYLWEKGWAERNGGNITVNITDSVDKATREHATIAGPFPIGKTLPNIIGNVFYCKGTNKRMRQLARDPMDNGCIIRICKDGASYEIIATKPIKTTSELPSHLAIHNYLIGEGYDYKACIHTHPIELVAMSHCKKFLDGEYLTKLLWSMIPETLAFAPLGIGVVPYALPGSLTLADATLKQIEKHDVVLWEKHGTVAVGPTIIDAFDQTDVLNKAACLYMTSKNMGFEPDGMTEADMQEIRDVFNLPTHR